MFEPHVKQNPFYLGYVYYVTHVPLYKVQSARKANNGQNNMRIASKLARDQNGLSKKQLQRISVRPA